MRIIDLTSYSVKAFDASGKSIDVPYDVKKSFTTLLFNPELKLAGRALLQQNDLAVKIEESDNEVLLEEEEYSRLKKAIDSFRGFGRNDICLVKRVLDAKQVEVAKKK